MRADGNTMQAQKQRTPSMVTIGSQVTWYPKSQRWRVEVIYPSTMKAAFIKHSVLADIAELDSHDPDLAAGLIQIHRGEIEEIIGMAELENWPDKLGVLPQGVDGLYQR